MIDSSVQTTIGTPIDWYKLEVMRDVINVKEAWESFAKNENNGVQVELNVIHARTQSLFNSLYPYLKRKVNGTKFDQMKKDLFGNLMPGKDVLRQIFWDIQEQLDNDNILKMDTRRTYDRTRAESENKEHGL